MGYSHLPLPRRDRKRIYTQNKEAAQFSVGRLRFELWQDLFIRPSVQHGAVAKQIIQA